jgi:hypothetical protein
MLKKFFWICSGADTDILDDCPKSEQEKYAGIGATVFFTAVMAFLAGSYALLTVFDNIWISIGLGIVWGLLIFNIDRYIVSTIKKRDKFRTELLQATPRIILAVIIAVVIARPLEMKIFEKEVEREILTSQNQMIQENQAQVGQIFAPEIARLEQENENLTAETSAKKAEVDALYERYISEAEGTDGTMKLGKGPVYKEKREKHDFAEAEYAELKRENDKQISDNLAQIEILRKQEDERIASTQPIIEGVDGFMARLKALDNLPFLPQFFIFLLFVAIETAPIFAKLMSPKGPYDLKLANVESGFSAALSSKINHREALANAENIINQRVYASIEGDDEVFQHRKQRARIFLNSKADKFYEEQEGMA